MWKTSRCGDAGLEVCVVFDERINQFKGVGLGEDEVFGVVME
jgi:hypothetical protein